MLWSSAQAKPVENGYETDDARFERALAERYEREPWRDLELSLSERCNLACRYCYCGTCRDELPNSGLMPWETAKRAIDWLCARCRGQDVSITFDWAKLGLGSAAPTKATDTLTEPDPDYQWLYQRMKQYHVPVWRCSLDIGDFGTKVPSFDGKTLKYHLPYHTYGIVELVP